MKTILSIAFLLCVNYVFGQDTTKVQRDTTKSHETIFTICEQMPEFPGGEKEWNKFLTENIKYPLDLERKKVGKAVYVTFVVEKDGSITGIKILRGLNEAIDGDVMRVMKMMPRWIAGKQNGKTVNVQYNFPVKFEPGKN
ncbi:MAG: TonB family protein [Bacteroidia bacterium]|nr:TonB family protein [Bacteroidia bacterium]